MAIYFIQCGEKGPIKIGYTNKKVKERMAELQTACPYELILLWIYRGSDYTEELIHEKLKHEHIRGEWFRPGKDVLNFIAINAANIYPIELNIDKKLIISEHINELITIQSEIAIIYLNYKTNKIFIESSDKIEVKRINK